MSEVVIKIDDVSKQYRLGSIGGGTLQADLQSWWAKVRGKEDPNLKIGAKTYHKNEKFMALNGVSFEVYRGDTLGIIGANGAGKSTLLKLLSRVTAPTKGSIYINGRISSMLEVGTGFHPELTGRENIYMNGLILGMNRTEINKKIDEIIAFSECEQFIDTPVKRYSSGMYVKLAFSVAAHLDSEILVMDEVLAVGDMKFQQKCLDKMSCAAGNEGRTVLYVSHNMNTIRHLCNRCIVFDHGNIIFDGDTEKAIEIYMNIHLEYLWIEKDLKNIRMKHLSTNQIVKMQNIKLLNKDKPIYTIGENLKFCLSWKNYELVDNMYLRLEVRYADETRIGAALSSLLKTDTINEINQKTFEFSLSNLAQGKYQALLVIYRKNIYGTFDDLDAVYPAFLFEIQNDGMEWNSLNWGKCVFNKLKIVT